MSADLAAISWPLSGVPEALVALARRAGFSVKQVALSPPPAGLSERPFRDVAEWLELCAGALGLELSSQSAFYGEALSMVRGAGPALLLLPGGTPRFIALLGAGRHKVPVFGSDHRIHHVETEALRAMLAAPLESTARLPVERMLERAGVPPSRRRRAERVILAERLAVSSVTGVFVIRPPPGASPSVLARRLGLPGRILTIFAAGGMLSVLLMAVFWTVGQAALSDHPGSGWLVAVVLLLLSCIPLRVWLTASSMLFATDAGALVKQRLLAGALRIDTSEMRKMGAGQLLGRAIEAEAIESLMLGGGLMGLLAAVELLLAALVLFWSGAGPLPALALLAWLLLTGWILWRYRARRRLWTRARLDMTHDLIEQIVGHRTRLAQEPAELFHEMEDQATARYLARSAEMDRAEVWMTAFLRRGFFLVGVCSLAPALLAGAPSSVIAVAIGGILMAGRGLHSLVAGASQLISATIAYEQLAPLYRASSTPEKISPVLVAAHGDTSREGVLLDARQIVFKYPTRAEPVLSGVSLQIRDGDRLLLLGPSGAGKSTLGAVLAGLSEPSSGLLLCRGMDLGTLGLAGFRKKVASAPQFHENHVLTGTFAFNLLMGRAWPPERGDLEEAEEICRELGLGPLLDKMPSGMSQVVGETGWQLSHGEKSRLYIARALLQRADLLVLDESFAALDPETLERSLRCVLSRANALVVIAHP